MTTLVNLKLCIFSFRQKLPVIYFYFCLWLELFIAVSFLDETKGQNNSSNGSNSLNDKITKKSKRKAKKAGKVEETTGTLPNGKVQEDVKDSGKAFRYM